METIYPLPLFCRTRQRQYDKLANYELVQLIQFLELDMSQIKLQHGVTLVKRDLYLFIIDQTSKINGTYIGKSLCYVAISSYITNKICYIYYPLPSTCLYDRFMKTSPTTYTLTRRQVSITYQYQSNQWVSQSNTVKDEDFLIMLYRFKRAVHYLELRELYVQLQKMDDYFIQDIVKYTIRLLLI